MNIYALSLDLMLVVLLLIAIAYCWRLDGKLKALRNGNMRMLEAARELQQSVLHAENAVGALRRSAEAAGRELQTKIDESRALASAAPVREPAADTVDFRLRRRSVL